MKIKLLIILLLCALLTDNSLGQQKTFPLKIGLIADPQYAYQDTKGIRYYSNSLSKLYAATTAINTAQVNFTVMVGDPVDAGTKDLIPTLKMSRRAQSIGL